MGWLEGEWSEAHLIADREHAPWFKACSDHPGVYRLIGLANEGDLVPAVIPRVCGSDDTGTIYIGAAKSLIGRIGRLVLQHLPPFKGGNHTAMPVVLANKFPSTKLAVQWRLVDAPEDIFSTEQKLLTGYKENSANCRRSTRRDEPVIILH